MCPKVSFADFSLRRVFWFRNRQSAWPFWHILVFASTFLTTLSVLLFFLLFTFLLSCRGLSLLLLSVISVKINFSDLWFIFFKGAEGAATTEWERPPPPPKGLWGKGGLYYSCISMSVSSAFAFFCLAKVMSSDRCFLWCRGYSVFSAA